MLDRYFDLSGRVALVTGGTSGLGLGMAEALSHAGATIAIAGLDDEGAGAAVETLREGGAEAMLVTADVAVAEDVERMTSDVVQALGGIDILVCSAGIRQHEPLLETEEAEIDRLMDVNVKGTLFCNKTVGRHMIERRRGAIINISSQGSFAALPGRSVYCAGKAAVNQLTRVLAADWASHGVRVNAIAPGLCITPMTEEVCRDEARIERLVARIPAGRLGVPDDLAGAVIFLASDAARYVIGHVLIVDGGWTLY